MPPGYQRSRAKNSQNRRQFCKTKPWPGCSEEVWGLPAQPKPAAEYHVPQQDSHRAQPPGHPGAPRVPSSQNQPLCAAATAADPPRLLQPTRSPAFWQRGLSPISSRAPGGSQCWGTGTGTPTAGLSRSHGTTRAHFVPKLWPVPG